MIAIFLAHVAPALASNYDELKSAALKRCASMDPTANQSGLAFNPEGYRSFYLRSECLQQAVIEFRDEALCSQVIERRSLLSSSWGYSRANCQKLVAAGIAADRKTLEEKRSGYLKDAIRMREFGIERNGNDRDFDIMAAFVGAAADGSSLRFDILLSPGSAPTVLLHESGYHIDGSSNLRIYVRQEDIRTRFAQFGLNQSYIVRVSLVLAIGSGDQGGKWSDAFIDKIFPAKERTQIMEKEIHF